ncbi:hypothetical protein [Methylomonas sp. AM2-LC]|uniref:hypothetical protein n=1 Tax=Methylomonas sp. AM2-LC TaxID=3153301 RepID=UPI003264E4AE
MYDIIDNTQLVNDNGNVVANIFSNVWSRIRKADAAKNNGNFMLGILNHDDVSLTKANTPGPWTFQEQDGLFYLVAPTPFGYQKVAEFEERNFFDEMYQVAVATL